MNPPSVTFWGAARTVTGSMHLIQVDGFQFLLDCGLYQGHRDEARERNSHFPFDPKTIHAVVLSHAHIDHCGNLPTLMRNGFRGPIYCTPATRDLIAVMLADSAKIQEEDAEYLNRKRDKGLPKIQPLYERTDVRQLMRQVEGVRYQRDFDLGHGVRFRFVEAGHLLGSAMVAVTINSGGQQRSLTFTGDLGRRSLPILRDPAPVPPAEFVISESTYGGQNHAPVDEMAGKLGEVVRRTFERGGKLLIPAFSLGRTQTIVYFLHQLMQAGQLPDLPIFVDSPLAANATEIFRLHPECFDDETASLLEDQPQLFGEQRIRYTRSVEDSQALNRRQDPCIIIAASGMCEAGRIQHHLKHNIEDPRCTILIAGFQAPYTLGRRLVEHQPQVRIHDHMWQLKAEVVVLNGFSSHADHQDLLTFLGPLAKDARKVCLVHGEPDRSEALAVGLRQIGFRDVMIPDRGETVPI